MIRRLTHTRRWLLIVAAAVAAMAVSAPPATAESTQDVGVLCTVPSGHDPAVIATVYQVAASRQVSDRVLLAGFEAGWIESHMNNLPCGDSDSLGVFQQRPSQGWGTPAQIMNVTYASNKFFDGAIAADRQCASCTAGQIAQMVQRSAHPERYDQAEAKARTLIAAARASAVDQIGLYRPENGTFYFPGGGSARLGDAGMVPLAGDWNRDGVDSIGVYKEDNQTFYLKNSNTSGNADGAFRFGNKGDIPLVGDWDGDGYDTIAVYRPSNQTFYLKNRNDNSGEADGAFRFGSEGDIPIAGNWDGDQYDTIGVYRPDNRTFYLKNRNDNSGDADGAFHFGNNGDLPVVGNWDGDPYDTIGVYRPGNRTFYLKNRNDNSGDPDIVRQFGNFDDLPIAGR
ncbi:hypothetical protein SAMN05216298_0229, partial [Glycomyces sambucus]